MARPRWTGPRILIAAALCLGILSSASAAGADEIRAVLLATNDLVFDPVRTRIYASVPSSGGVFANSIVAIDPVAGTILGSIATLPPGSEPGRLALSGDSQLLYIALAGTAGLPPAVRRVDLTGATPDLQFPLGSDPSRGPWSVEDMAVVPGTPRAIAVTLKFADGLSPRHVGVAVYDDGVRRPMVATGPIPSNVIEFSDNPSRLFGLDTETGTSGFSRMLVSSSGVSAEEQDVFLEAFGMSATVTDIVFDSSRLYATNGRVIFPESLIKGMPESVATSGTYPGVPANALVLPDSTSARTYFLASNTLFGFAQATFDPIGTLQIPSVSGLPGSLIRWGPGRVAFRTDGGQVYLIAADFTGFVGSFFPTQFIPAPSLRDLVAGFFQTVLARAPDPAGLAAWESFLQANCNTSGLRALSAGFFDSEEFRLARPLSLQGLVEVLYRTFLGRSAEPAEAATWGGVLREIRLQVATEGFIPSPEFHALLSDPTDRAAVTEVLQRLYADVLGRAPDPEGLTAWADFIVATGDVKAAARGFLASAEFEARALTARDYVAILYRTFLGREAAAAELEAWEEVFRTALLHVIDSGFAASAEFQAQLVPMCR